MSKTKKIVLIIIITIATLVILAWIFVPRLIVLYVARELEEDLGPGAEYFTEYNTTLENVQSISYDGLTMNIPTNYVEKDIELKVIMYIVPDETNTAIESVLIMDSYDLSEMNLFSEENLEALTADLPAKIGVNQIVRGFEALGNGLPDSAYGTYKSSALLTTDDYSFWNLKQGIAYVISGMLKYTSIIGDYNYIYENEDICGLIHVTLPENQEFKYYIIAEMFSTDDLGTEHTVLIKTNSLEEAYGMINSITIE